jgi:hypothetical protein
MLLDSFVGGKNNSINKLNTSLSQREIDDTFGIYVSRSESFMHIYLFFGQPCMHINLMKL